MQISSPAFADGEPIPAIHSADGAGTSPPLQFSAVPAGAVSLVLIVEDPDVPRDRIANGVFNHWVVFGLDPACTGIEAGADPSGITGRNSKGTNSWVPMAPPAGHGAHRYFFNLYALDCDLNLGQDTDKDRLLATMTGHVIEHSVLMGTFVRN